MKSLNQQKLAAPLKFFLFDNELMFSVIPQSPKYQFHCWRRFVTNIASIFMVVTSIFVFPNEKERKREVLQEFSQCSNFDFSVLSVQLSSFYIWFLILVPVWGPKMRLFFNIFLTKMTLFSKKRIPNFRLVYRIFKFRFKLKMKGY